MNAPAGSALRLVTLVAALCFSALAQGAVTLNVGLGPNPVRASESVRGEITVANNGGGAVAAVTVRITLPANITGFSGALWSGGQGTLSSCTASGTSNCDPNEVLTWTVGTLAAGASATMTFMTSIPAATADGTAITLNGELFINAVSSATDGETVTVANANALSISVDESEDTVAQGGALTYDLTYGNRGLVTLTGTTMTFPVPAGTTFVSASGGGSFSAGVVTWSLGSLASGDSGRRQVVVTVGAGLADGQQLVVDAAVISGTGAALETARALAFTAVRAVQSLGLGLETGPDPVRQSESMHPRITVTNRSGGTLFNVRVLLRMPPTINGFPVALFGGGPGTMPGCTGYATSNCDPYEALTWTVGTLPAGANGSISLPSIVNAAVQDGRVIGWEAMALADGDNIARATHSISVDGNNALSLNVDDREDSVAPNAALTYDLTYGNRSVTTMTGATLTFPVPAGATFVSATGGGTLSGGVVTWNLGAVTAGDSGRRQVVVTAGGSLGDGRLIVVDAATITGTGSITESARAMAVTAVRATQPIGVGIEVGPDPVRQSESMHPRFTVTNRSGATLFNVRALVRLPETINGFPTATFGGGPGTMPVCTGYSTANCDPYEVLTWTIGNLPAGAGAQLSMPSIVNAGVADGRPINWEVTVLADSNTIARGTHSVTVDGGNALMLNADTSTGTVAPNGSLTYSLTYGNRGISSLSGATLTFPVPAGATFVSATGGGTLSGGVVTWNLGTLVAGSNARRQVTVTAGGALADGQLLVVDSAAITGTGAIQENARALAVNAVQATQPIGVALEMNPDPVRANDPFHNRVTVTNRSGSTLFNVHVDVRLTENGAAVSPALFTGGPATFSGCTGYSTSNCDPYEVPAWDIATLAPGAGVTFSFPSVMGAIEDGRLSSNEVIVLADSNFLARATHTVATEGTTTNPLLLTVDDSADPVPTGGTVVYNLTYGNRGISSVSGATLSFPIPAGATLVNQTGGTVTGNVINWNLGTLNAGQGGRRRVMMSVGGGANPGDLLAVDAAEIAGTLSGATRSARGTAATRIATAPALRLTSAVSPNPVANGGTLTTALTLTNTTGSSLSGVVLRLRVPNYVNGFPSTLLSPTGPSCTGYGTSNCDQYEVLNWAVGTLGAGASFVASAPPVVIAAGGPAVGQLIPITALAQDDLGDSAAASNTALVGTFTDTDGDGVAQVFDNCLNVSNASQLDTNFDGYGNICDGDLNNSLLTTTADFTLLRSVLNFGSGTSALAADADMNGSGLVTTADFTLLRSYLNQPPGPSGMAP